MELQKRGDGCSNLVCFVMFCFKLYPTFAFAAKGTHETEVALYRVSQEERTKFGRVFLMLKYTDITKNTYIQS